MAKMYIPGYTIRFSSKALIDTPELLEELGIPYQTLASRIRLNSFPKPVTIGRNGKAAQYDRQEVINWLKDRKFRLDE